MTYILDKRINDIQHISTIFENPNRCLSIKGDYIIDSKSKKRLFKIVKKLGEGAINIVYKICTDTNENDCYAIRINNINSIYEKPEIYESCISNYYSLIFSNIVKTNISPNFPIIINSFMCDDIDIPISIQELAIIDGIDFMNSYEAKSISLLKSINIFLSDKIKFIIQVVLTLYFMNVHLNISHVDVKADNILVKELSEPVNIVYKIKDDMFITIKNVKYLALITDFDFTINNNDDINNTKYKNTMKLFKQYNQPFHRTKNYNSILQGHSFLNRDIVQFLFNIYGFDGPSYREVEASVIREKILLFINNLIIYGFYDSIQEFVLDLRFKDITLSKNIPISSQYKIYDYSKDINYTLPFKKYDKLYTCLILSSIFKQFNWDDNINRLFNFNRFNSDVDIDVLNAYINNYPENNQRCKKTFFFTRYTPIKITQNIRKNMFKFLIDTFLGSDVNKSTLFNIFKFVDLYVSNTDCISKYEYYAIGLMFTYLINNNPNYNITFFMDILRRNDDTYEYSKQFMYNILLKILHTLYDTRNE